MFKCGLKDDEFQTDRIAQQIILEEVPPIDSDSDGVPDIEDAFPENPTETKDTDSDGVGDNADAFPNDVAASVDEDGDGHPDEWNTDMTRHYGDFNISND